MDPHPTIVEVLVDALTKTTGLVAAVAGLLVVLSGRRELRRWRDQKLTEKKAEAAAAALVAAVDLLDIMDLATTPVGLKGDPEKEKDQPYSDFMRTWFQERAERFIRPKLDALERTRSLAHVYLSADQNQALDEVVGHVNGVFGEVMAWTTFLDGGPGYHPQAQESFRKVFGEDTKAKRKALRDRVSESLRMAAQFKE